MARTKEFDPEVALQRALELFWERGYEATSTAELVAHLGVARASIYATFGDKRRLYLKALERYLRITDESVVGVLSAGPALAGVHRLIDRYAEKAAADAERVGCMVVNAAVESSSRDAEVHRLVESSWSFLEASLTSALARARAEGDLPADREPRALARMLLVFFQGIQVMGRAPADADRIRDAAAQMRALLG
ncbi:transcriptional regulator, TetR family [Saccharopolyspora kobensis]|uniref:Transcriptional regulator, TetR family n=1 Tax=Saccharopolyspora kobensis TaxID=146035 RepID=A0A1H5XZ25_9PSEU|nr:TetR/AcrR family transcriptional regulator [Saccharopolyspora kobensis]SEG16951.1 transcriptional regulator, TetR family [Saccharopolyspora kobensis]SFF10027.1 transcriptional regulator, TetR family [Saccharopolyspora kobensis]